MNQFMLPVVQYLLSLDPKSVLTNLVNNILDGKPHIAIALNPNAKKDSDRQFAKRLPNYVYWDWNCKTLIPIVCRKKFNLRAKKSSISVKLNGGLYLSEKTKAAFQNAINQKEFASLAWKVKTRNQSQLIRNSSNQ